MRCRLLSIWLLLGCGAAAPAAAPQPETVPVVPRSTRVLARPPELGAPVPVRCDWADDEGRWVAIEQPVEDSDGDARLTLERGTHGDARRTTIFVDGAPQRAVDAVLAASDTADALVVQQGLALLLLFPLRDEISELAILTTGSQLRGATASLDRGGSRLLYGAPARAGALELTLRELGTAEERRVVLPGHRMVGAAIDPGGRFAWVLGYPGRTGDLTGMAWGGALRVESLRDALEAQGIEETMAGARLHLVPLPGDGPRRPALDAQDPSLLAVFGDGVLRSRRGGAVYVVVPGRRRRHRLVPAECGARLLRTWPVSETVLVRCTREGQQSLELYGPDRHEVLAMAPPEAVPRRLQVPEGRYATVPGWLIDLETWAVHDLGAWPLATDDDRVVFRRDGRLVWRDLAAGEERDLGPAPGQRWPQRRAGALVQLAETLVDVRAGRRLDVRVTAEPLAVATDGRLLMPTNGWQHGVACGPIAWWPPESLEAFRPHRSCRDRIGGPMHLLPFPD